MSSTSSAVIRPGAYFARVQDKKFGQSNDGKPCVTAMFEITSGHYAGRRVKWTGWLTPAAAEKTLEQLKVAGWRGGRLSELQGFGDREVSIVVVQETHLDKVFASVRWINKPPSLDHVKATDMKSIDDIGARFEPAEPNAATGATRVREAAPPADIGGDEIPF
jgi:hypothetical protein